MRPQVLATVLLLGLLGCDEAPPQIPAAPSPHQVSLPLPPTEAVPIAGGLFTVRLAGVTRVDETCRGGALGTHLAVEADGSTAALDVRTLASALDASPPAQVMLGEGGAEILLARPDGARASVSLYCTGGGCTRTFLEALVRQAVFAPGDAPMLALGAEPFPPERRPDERHPEPGDPPRSVVLGGVEVEGGQTVLGVTATATNVLDQLECCWHRALLARNVRTGAASAVASLDLDASGAATSVTVDGGDEWSGLADCLESVLAGFRLPPASAPSHARITLDLSTPAP